MPTCRRWLAIAAAAGLAFLLPLVGYGGGGGDGDPPAPAYALRIDGPAVRSTVQPAAVLTGEGFLPPGSTCPGECSGLLPPPVFGELGAYTLRWRNEASGATGTTALVWICNCGGNAPTWIARVPVVPGANRIVVTMSAGGITQTAAVSVTRS